MAAGVGLAMPSLSTGILQSVPMNKAGVGSAVNDTTRELGGAIGIAVVGTIVNSIYRSKLDTVLCGAAGVRRRCGPRQRRQGARGGAGSGRSGRGRRGVGHVDPRGVRLRRADRAADRLGADRRRCGDRRQPDSRPSGRPVARATDADPTPVEIAVGRACGRLGSSVPAGGCWRRRSSCRAKHGAAGLTVEAVAARSGVAKTTIYRQFAGQDELHVAAVESLGSPPPVPSGKGLVDGRRRVGDPTPCGAVWRADGGADPHDHRRSRAPPLPRRVGPGVLAPRRGVLISRLEHRVADGELVGPLDADLLASQLVGPLFYRRFISRQPDRPRPSPNG